MSLTVDLHRRMADFELSVAFGAKPGEITALFGPSGAGKTSIANAVAGLLSGAQGRIALNGDVLMDSSRGIFVPARRRRVGYVFQEPRLFPHLDVRANLLFGAKRTPTPPSADEIAAMIDLLGIEALLARKPATLSGGERQRIALGRAMLAKPRILLLDEPLAALDIARKNEILPFLERVRDASAIPILYVSHALDEIIRLADRVVIVERGCVTAGGTIFEVMARPELAALTGRSEAGAVLDARIAAQHAAESLTEVVFDEGRLWIPQIPGETGRRVRVRIRARDVMLALSRPDGISANNVVRGTVADIHESPGPYQDIVLACGSARLIASVTKRSLTRLNLGIGMEIYAVIKSVTVDRADPHS